MLRTRFFKKNLKILGVGFVLISFYMFTPSNLHLQLGNFLKGDEKVDWNDYAFILYEASRVGPGENGTAHTLTDPAEIELNKIGIHEEGVATIVSEQVSLNRSLIDQRLPQ